MRASFLRGWNFLCRSSESIVACRRSGCSQLFHANVFTSSSVLAPCLSFCFARPAHPSLQLLLREFLLFHFATSFLYFSISPASQFRTVPYSIFPPVSSFVILFYFPPVLLSSPRRNLVLKDALILRHVKFLVSNKRPISISGSKNVRATLGYSFAPLFAFHREVTTVDE